MFIRILKGLASLLGLYYGYCFVRGFVYGFTHMDPKTRDPEMAQKIATFRA